MVNKKMHLKKDLYNKDIEQIPTRNGYGEGLVELGNKDPNIVLRLFWKWRDAFKEFFDFGMKKLSGQRKKTPWSRIFNTVLTSIKQSRINKF